MKSTQLALAIVVLCGAMSACRQDAPAPAAEATPPEAAEPVATTPDPMPTDDTMDDDAPHTGGDRVGTGGGGGAANAADEAAESTAPEAEGDTGG
jgi:hypothetical protein